MQIYTFEVISNIIQIIILLTLLIGSYRLLKNGRDVTAVVFFLFGIFATVIVDFYWLAYDLMKPEVRMPFAANEFGEVAMFLLFASAITTVFHGKLTREAGPILLSAVFVAASVGLWIAWSGEWLQDIITGGAFGYLICVTVMAMRAADSFSKNGWALVGICAILLVLCQASVFFLPESLKTPADTFCYIFMFAVLLTLLVKCSRSIWADEDRYKILALSYACYVWATSTMYMSSGVWYVAALSVSTLGLVLMFVGIRKGVQAE